MYRIIFKGQVPEEYVGEVEGRALADAWEANRLSHRVKINDNLYESSSIKAILSGFQNPDTGGQKSQNADMLREIDEDYQVGIKGLLALSPGNRALNTGIAELAYTILTHGRMPQDLREQVIARQAAYFEENPDRPHANPSCYRDLMPKPILGKEGHISNTTTIAGMDLIERIVGRSYAA